jgi:hypothetical protein
MSVKDDHDLTIAGRRAAGRRRGAWSLAGLATAAWAALLFSAPSARAGLVPGVTLPPLPVSLPPLPVSLPPLPLPTVTLPPLPLPTITLPPLPTIVPPSLPLPTLGLPTLPVPSVALPSASLPLPSLPIGSSGPGPSGASGFPPSGDPSTDPSSSAGASPLLAPESAGPGTSLPSAAAGVALPPPGGGGLETIILPALIAGIPLLVIALIILAQTAGGAAWLTVIRRWLNRSVVPADGRARRHSESARRASSSDLEPVEPS